MKKEVSTKIVFITPEEIVIARDHIHVLLKNETALFFKIIALGYFSWKEHIAKISHTLITFWV